jgi:hypothetical protein
LQADDVDDEEENSAALFTIRNGKKGFVKRLQQYVHFGLRSALTGESVGITHRQNYLSMLECLSRLKPKSLGKGFLHELKRNTTKSEVCYSNVLKFQVNDFMKKKYGPRT